MSSPPLTPDERRLRSQLANSARWSRIPRSQRAAHTEAARAAQWQRYLDAVPAEVTDPAERQELADLARRADLARLSLASSRARARRRQSDLESQAVARFGCPVCPAVPGQRCGAPSGVGRRRDHPHPERLALLGAGEVAG